MCEKHFEFLKIKPNVFIAFLQILSIWAVKLSEQSIVIPRSLIDFTCYNVISFML